MFNPDTRPDKLPSLDIRPLDPSSAPRGSGWQQTAYVADSIIVFGREAGAVQEMVQKLVGQSALVRVAPVLRADLKPLAETAVQALLKVTISYESDSAPSVDLVSLVTQLQREFGKNAVGFDHVVT